MKAKRLFAGALVAAVLVSSSRFEVATVKAEVPSITLDKKQIKGNLYEVSNAGDLKKVLDNVRRDSFELLDIAEPEAEQLVHVIITLDDASILEMDGEAKLDFANRAKVRAIEGKQLKLLEKIEEEVFDGASVKLGYQYSWLMNGFSIEVPYKTLKAIGNVPGVKDVILEPVYEISKEDSAELKTIVDGEMIQRGQTWAAGYTGKGMKISIVDTGLDLDHPNFEALPEDKLTDDSLTKEDITEVLTQLHAYEQYPGLTVDDVYYSSKVAYAFNYADRNLTVDHSSDDQGFHGTHVAGIAAANKAGEEGVVGVAPDAQLYVMKVFGATRAGYTEDIIAALEDSLILGADVVNMSLGSTSGFSTGGEVVDAAYARVADTSTILCIAAGNEATAGEYNKIGFDKNFAWDPDNATVGAPGTYATATTVGSVDNVAYKASYLACGDHKFEYYIPTSETNESIHKFDGESLAFAPVGNCGQTAEDFAAADVSGKVALVSRGVTTFVEKIQLAQDAGAIACIIYNNQDGVIGMDLSSATSTIPAFSIKQADGLALIAALAADENAKIDIFDKTDFLPNETGYQMSSFSSWGVTPDLKLEPDVAAPGGHIYSTIDGGEYGDMSGTSMATPNTAGVTALIKQYAKENYNFSETELRNFVNAVLMSTAKPLDYDEDTKFSPRQQGSGLVSTYNAIATRAYLSVDGMDFPKVNLFDDVEKVGKYSFSYDVNNFGTKPLYYAMKTTVQTEDVYVYANAIPFMANAPVSLTGSTSTTSEKNMVLTYDYNEDGAADILDAADLFTNVKNQTVDGDYEFRYELDQKEGVGMDDVQAYLNTLVGNETTVDLDAKVMKVAPNAKATIDVAIELSDEDKAYMDMYFENGIYVEGFSYLEDLTANGIDLSLPYMGFYGDWTKASIFDNSFVWEGENSMACFYEHGIYADYGEKTTVPGMNPFFDEEFDPKNIAFSPNGDGYCDNVVDLYVSLLRNAKDLNFRVTDAATGEEYFWDYGTYFRKSTYNNNYGLCLPFVFSMYLDDGDVVYDFTKEDGTLLANNTKLIFSVDATLDYDKHASNNGFDVIEYPIVIDTEAPEAIGYDLIENEGKEYFVLYASDNHNIAGGAMLTMGQQLVDLVPRTDIGEEGTYGFVFDITELSGSYLFLLEDYAANDGVYELDLDEVRAEFAE